MRVPRTASRFDKAASLKETLAGAEVRNTRIAMIEAPQIADLTIDVRGLMTADRDVPWFDPQDAGVTARLLVLLESPAKSTITPHFVSRDNCSPT